MRRPTRSPPTDTLFPDTTLFHSGLKSNHPQNGDANGWPEKDIYDIERLCAQQWRSLVSRTGRVEEIAALICFMASVHSAYITGTNYRIDGGSHAPLH